MLTETGKVIAIEDDGLWVETLQLSACAQCAARQGCGQRVLAKAGMQNLHHVNLKTNALTMNSHSCIQFRGDENKADPSNFKSTS